jgi:hypothetical protein
MASVTVIAGRERIAVPPIHSASPPIVPAQQVVVEIEGTSLPFDISVNDESVPLIRTVDATRGHLLLDCFRSTGFHRLLVGTETYCFGTADAKLQLEGILRILDMVGREGLSWGHQLMFSDGATIRDSRVDYAWLRGTSRRILSACSSIASRPLTRSSVEPRFQRPQGGRLRLADTIARIRRDPRDLLEAHPAGPFKHGSRRFMPRMAVLDSPTVSHDTSANRRATRLLRGTLDLIASIGAGQDVPKRQRTWLKLLETELRLLLDQFPFKGLATVCDRISESPSVAELTDPRYRVVYELCDELFNLCGWAPSRKLANRFAYISYSDEIYQAFVALLLASAFDAKRVLPYLRKDMVGPSFRSDDWDIYYDTAPPAPSFASWRDHSSRPARLTPDYCIVDRRAGRGILGDAKYRGNGGGGRLPMSSIGDCQIYMQHFGLKNFAVFYPGADAFMSEITGDGHTILEVSITPFTGVAAWVAQEVRPALVRLLEPLRQ